MLVRLLYYVNLGTGAPKDGESLQSNGDLENDPGMDSPQRQEWLDKNDLARHKEVVTEAVSGVIILLLTATKSLRKRILNSNS